MINRKDNLKRWQLADGWWPCWDQSVAPDTTVLDTIASDYVQAGSVILRWRSYPQAPAGLARLPAPAGSKPFDWWGCLQNSSYILALQECSVADLQQYYGRQLVTILHPEIHTLMISGLVEPQEAAVAVQLVREQFAGRCVAGLSVGSGPQGLQTVMGWSVTEAIQQLELWGAQIIALEGPVVISAMLPIVQCCRKLTSLPLAVFPMAGSPELIDERVDYRLEPADFAEQAAALIEAGVDILGGGRGVDSAHIKSLFELSVSQPNKTKRTSPRKNNE